MTQEQTPPIKVNGPAGSLWDQQEMMPELIAYLDWLARNPPQNDQSTTNTAYTSDEHMNYYPVNFNNTNMDVGHAPMEGGSGMANTPEADVGWQGVAPWADSPVDTFDFNSSLPYGPYTYHGAVDDHELSDYQSS
ncbi:hypothetical protein BD410DRAFT_176416 [Rickenella mellea]|uniref:Uncharacterized protein n=1 Tax=Rickenella mellea TaxID=50990 RepID=A0A4Y7Q6T6_9AGAM|nr:hypothetical protein BD410DRAFT_176416 [Rickenella mellea]